MERVLLWVIGITSCILFSLCLILAISLPKDNLQCVSQPKSPVLYYKDIDVVVIKNEKRSRSGKVKTYTQTITVKSEEYGLEETFVYTSGGMFAKMPYWNKKEGDIVKAILSSWQMESTGEITKRRIENLE